MFEDEESIFVTVDADAAPIDVTVDVCASTYTTAADVDPTPAVLYAAIMDGQVIATSDDQMEVLTAALNVKYPPGRIAEWHRSST